MKLIINCETAEETLQELSQEELQQLQIDQEAHDLWKSKEKELQIQKENALNKLAVLGLTPAEIQAIIK